MLERILNREQLGNLRELQILENCIDFASNDYLGLARSPELHTSVLQEVENKIPPFNGLGSTGSRLLTGNTAYAENLEEQIANFHGFEAGLLFNCGYMANLGLLSSIPETQDTIFYDSAVHASTHDGIRLSKAIAFPFRHNDLCHLEKRLKSSSKKGRQFICIESIYSMDGSKAPLVEMCRLAQEYKANLIIDEAHAVGVCGPQGRGLVAEQNLSTQIFAQVTTFGKALGTHGAIVLGNTLLREMLINFATPYIYTTALPFHSLAAIKCSYEVFPKLELERKHIRQLIHNFLKAYPKGSTTQIQSIPIQGNEKVKKLSKQLAEKGIRCTSDHEPDS